jgi:hypothetical protein
MTPAQAKMLTNISEGRDPGHGFPRGKYAGRPAAAVAAALYARGWTVHSRRSGPAMLLTPEGQRALREHLEGA